MTTGRTTLILLAIIATVASCAAPAPPSDRPSAPASPAPSAADAPDPVPDGCDAMLRADTTAAQRIRSSVDFQAGRLATGSAAIARIAADPASDVTAYGIPLRPEELADLREQGLGADPEAPMAFWVNYGRPERFGGVWVDPPGSGRLVVSIVDDDPGTRALAACLERPDLDVRYVVTDVSKAELDALQGRIDGEWEALWASGIRIVQSGVRTSRHRVEIEVEGVSQRQTAFLIDRYGPYLEVSAVPIPTPDRPLTIDEVPISIGESGLLSASDGGRGEAGSWRLLGGRLTGTALVLDLEIAPPPVDLPVDAGPAVLYAGMQLYGGSADMGMSEPLDALAAVDLPRCAPGPDCRFRARLELPRAQIMPALRRLESKTDEILWLEIDPTLVRTFAGGTWLQTLPLTGSTRTGRLGDIVPVDGPLPPMGLVPASMVAPIPAGDGMFTEAFDWAASVERRRRKIGDLTRPVPQVDGTLRVDFDPPCAAQAGLSLHSSVGDLAVDVRPIEPGQTAVEASFSVPVDTTWRLSIHDGWGIDYQQRGGWGMPIGDEIRAEDEPLAVTTTIDCPRAMAHVPEPPPDDDRRPVRPGTNGRSP